jgi:hypothetical protein
MMLMKKKMQERELDHEIAERIGANQLPKSSQYHHTPNPLKPRKIA